MDFLTFNGLEVPIFSCRGMGLDSSYGNLGCGCQQAMMVPSSVNTIFSSLYPWSPGDDDDDDDDSLVCEKVRALWRPEAGNLSLVRASPIIVI